MKNKQIARLNMYIALENLMNKNEKTWENVKELGKALKKFSSNISELKELKDGTEIDLSEFENKMEKSRKALIKEAGPVINILKVYSKDIKDKSLQKKLNSIKKGYNDLKDSKLIDYCKTVWKDARKLYNKALSGSEKSKLKIQQDNSILNYGLSGKMIDNLEEEQSNFETSFNMMVEARQKKSRAMMQIEAFCRKNQRILKNKVDLLVSIFENENPDFLKNYLLLRNSEKNGPAKDKTKASKIIVKEETRTSAKKVGEEKPEIKKRVRKAPVKTVTKTAAPKKSSTSGTVKTTPATNTKVSKSPVSKTRKSAPPKRKPLAKKVETETLETEKTENK